MTIERRFGDCKDKALLLVALLTELGIPAWPALVDTTSGPLVPQRQPSPGAFDHVVVVAEIAGKTRWIDPTISFQGGTLTESAIPDYGFGLVLRAGETEPVAIPKEQTDPGEIHATYTYEFSDDGTTASVEVVTEYLGGEADAQRYSFADTTPEELQDSYTDYYSTTTGRAVAVEPLEIEDDRRANRIVTHEHYQLEDWWYLSDGERIFDLLPILLASLLQTEDLSERRAPLDLPRRFRRFESVRIHAPSDWLLDGVVVETGAPWFNYRVTPKHDGATLQMDHELVVGDQPVKPDEIAAFNQAVEVMVDAAGYSIGESGSEGSPDRRTALVAVLVVIAAAAVMTILVGWLLFRWRLL